MLLNLKGGTCQHLRIRIFVTKPLSADWYLPAWTNHLENSGTWQCRREAGAVARAFGSVQLNRKGVNILAKVLSPFFCLSSSNRYKRESKTTAWRDFCERMLLNLKGGTCQHLDYEHICPTHIFVTKRRLILACMHKPFRELRYLAVSQSGRRRCPGIWLSAIEPKRCQHLGKGTQPFLLSALVKQIQKRIKDNSMTGLLWKNVAKCEGWNLSTSGLWAYGEFTSLSLSADWYLPAWTCMNKPFRELRYLAASQRGRRSCPRSWLSAIEQHLGKGTRPCCCQSSSTRKQRESKTTAWPDFCERMLPNVKGGTCQHLDYQHMANSHLGH